jgi:TonB family protein
MIRPIWRQINPVAIIKPNPSYTERARNARVSGVVLLECIVRKDGSVNNCRIIRGLGYGLDESAIRTIENEWRCQPGIHKGKAVDVRAFFETQFKIY